MGDAPSAPPPGEPEDRLDSWKEIAAYLRRDVTTVQRWERREGMPVSRHVHDKMGSVYAFRTELDAWTRRRNLPVARHEELIEQGPATPTRRRGRTIAWSLIAVTLLAAISTAWWVLERRDYFWSNPLADARFQNVTDFGGAEQGAAISRDGKFVAFLSDRDGTMDVWVTQVEAGQSHNLTHGRFQGLGNPSLRMLGFSPDATLVTFWTRGVSGSDPREISVWAVPTLGGQAEPYLEGAAEFDWSRDGRRLVYHTPGPGDPTFVRNAGETQGRPIFVSSPGLHAHFQTWSPDATFIYFVQGTLPDALDIWRIRPTGGTAERITHHNSRVSHPVLLNEHTLMYLATDAGGNGPWLYSTDVDHRVPHRVSAGFDRYTSLAVSADGSRLVATLANPNGTFWGLDVSETPAGASALTPISVPTGRGYAPRFGPDYLLYVSSKAAADGIWKLVGKTATELWSAPDSRLVGGPEIAPDGRHVAFSIKQRGRTLLYTMNADGTDVRVLTDSLTLQGEPAWAPDGQSITSAASADGTPHLFRVALNGRAVPLVNEYSLDPVWSPAGDFVVYSGADIGTTFPVKAATAAGAAYSTPNLTLTRGGRRMRFFHGQRALVVMRGDIQHKNLWLVDLDTGAERQLTNLAADFNLHDFDVSADGREIVLERVQEHSDIVLIDLARLRN